MNGMKFIAEQLESIRSQTGGVAELLISDDGSTDGTRAYLSSVIASMPEGKALLLDGPNCGFAENFRNLILRAPSGRNLYVFSDQDDLWDADRLITAHEWLHRIDRRIPALHCGRTRIVDKNAKRIGLSPLFRKQPSFKNAIVQSLAGGNTMAMNEAAFALLREACLRTGFVSHDWWAYMIVTGAGGKVHYSSDPKVSYRQHAGNLVGSRCNFRKRLHRLRKMADGQFMRWNAENLESLRRCEDLLTPESRQILKTFTNIREMQCAKRLAMLARSGIHRQTALGQFSLYAACLLGKI